MEERRAQDKVKAKLYFDFNEIKIYQRENNFNMVKINQVLEHLHIAGGNVK